MIRRAAVALGMLLVVVGCGGGYSTAPPQPPPPPPPPPPPDGIAQARAATDGATNLAISGVTVTYLKPALGNDVAGFTIQHDQTGPALFIAVDPATLSPAAAVGDVVNFTITQMGTTASQRRAQALASYARQSIGASIAALTQNVSAATDLVSAVDNYDSEIITAAGTIGSGFAASGTAFQSATLSTAGIAGNASLQLRAPSSLIDSGDVVNSCQITATRVPFGRFNATAQVGVFRAGDIALSGCPAPTVVSAAAVSSTSVQITFTRRLTPASVNASGSQFTFDNGLTASAATVSGRSVTVTTSAQIPSTNYGVTVAHSVTDLQGIAVTTPDVASFSGFVTPAVLRVNEVNANIANGCDLIELRVISGGSIGGFHVLERTGVVANSELNLALPSMTVATNDLIVVHMNGGSATCNPGGATQETASKTEQPASTFAGNYDTAFDIWASDAGLTNTDNVFTVTDAAGAIVDALFASDDPAGVTTTTATEQQAAIVGAANQWSPAMASYIDAVFRQNAVDDLNANGVTATGNSIQRLDNTDDNDKADWTTGAGAASTFGLLNAGQAPFPSRRRGR